jgi:hypothetical protein
MTPEEQLILELQKINKKLDVISNPFKNAAFNFTSGIWHALGSLFGTVFVAAAIVYILSRLNFGTSVTKYLQKMIPSPQINVTESSSQP